MEKDKREPVRLVLPVDFESKPSAEISLQAFLFNRKGGLIEKKDVVKNVVEFVLKDLTTNDVRVFIAPKGDERLDRVQTISGLENFKPYEVVFDRDPHGNIKILPIPDYLSRLWNLRLCRIRGRVTKNFAIGNIWQERGICHARVHICEVDRIWWWIARIPNDIIRRIPEIILKPEWPIPIPDPGPIDEVSLNPQPLPPGPELLRPGVRSLANLTGISESTQRFNVTDQDLEGISKISARRANIGGNLTRENFVSGINIPQQIKSQFLSEDIPALRKAIIENFQILHPIFCRIPWLWPYFYRCDEIKVVYTDVNGFFDTTYVYWWDGDKPDLYFWVEYLIDGIWTTVYKPPVPCNVYWDYTCGSEVVIHITDPRVRWECNNVIDGDIIWVKTIGESASIVHMPQTDMFSLVQGKNFNRIGLSDVSVWASANAVGDFRRPFGGNLGFKVQFGSGLPSNGMYYYRWSYRKRRNADLSSLPLTAPTSLHGGQALYKGYTYEYFDMLLHKHFGFNSFKLGPFSKNGNDDLYIIPPAFPVSAPVNAPELSPLWNQDTWTVWFDSTKYSDGLYEFFLELFDFAGNKLNAIPSHFFQVPDYNTFAPSVDAPASYLVSSGPGLSNAFKMFARLDNQRAEADIYSVKVNGSVVATDCCGFVPYPPGANVELSFRAYHPENFATFSFEVQKGTCEDDTQTTLTNAGGMVIGDAGNYSRNNSSIYSHTFTPAQLLGICSTGGKAAFAEHLYVKALATDGSNQLFTLDASKLAAFALTPV